jgi:hypothetical protein
MKNIKQSPWLFTASIVSGLVSLGTLVLLLLIWFVWKLHLHIGGWDGIAVNPYSLIDVAILMFCSIGIWFKPRKFVQLLVVYQVLNVVLKVTNFISTQERLLGVIISIAFLMLYIKAYNSTKDLQPSLNFRDV